LIRTIDDAMMPDSSISMSNILSHTDQLILDVVDALEGEQETEIVRRLLRLRSILGQQVDEDIRREGLSAEAEAARAEVINIVNNFFYEKLTAMPAIKAFMEEQAGA
jgi:hypothetical protein